MLSSTINLSLPPQMLPLRDKLKNDKKWAKDSMDALEAIGRQQFYNNLRLVENYEMVRGKFIYSHYIDREDYGDMISQLTREFDMPSHLRHYDIISQVINTLSGEYQKRPDLFRVTATDENSQNNYLRAKTDMLIKWVKEELDTYVAAKLVEEGLDPDKQDFQSEEEMQAYQQEIQQRKQELTPKEIQKYMDTKWMDASEQWAEHQVEWDKQRFNLPEKEKIEFEDMLIADRCFRHFHLTSNGYNQETWNPINTFFHKSPEVQYVENGDYVGRVFYLTLSDIINRYGYRMTEEQLLDLERYKKDNYKSSGNWQADSTGLVPGTMMPHQNFPEQKQVQDLLGYNPLTPQNVDIQILEALGDSGEVNFNKFNLHQITEGYWMSARLIGKYCFLDPETGEPNTILVDETFNLPGVEEVKTSFMEFAMGQDRPNTVVWTWINQVWTGVKINTQFSDSRDPLYLDLKPADFQFRGEMNIYGARLPVCGQIFNNRNSESQSTVDLMKADQIGHNVAMNQLYEIMQREIGRFMLMDFNFIPSGKDWGGERNFEKLMLIARQLGVAPIDGSPSNVKGSNFAHFQMVDLDESSRMISRMNIATFFETQALKQIGFSPQRTGDVSASETATGTQQAAEASYTQTESLFTNYSNFKRRCLQMGLEIAQYVQSKEEDIMFNYVKSDMSRAFIKINGTDLLLSEFGIYIVKSQELIRQLETLRQLFIQNNTTGASPVDLATVVTSNSPSEIRNQIETSWNALQAQQAQQQQSAQESQERAIQMQNEDRERERTWKSEEAELDRANDRYVAEIKAIGVGTVKTGPDADASGAPDVLEIQKFNAELGKHTEDILFKERQEQTKRLEGQQKVRLEEKKIALKKRELEANDKNAEEDRKVEREKLAAQRYVAKINKN